MVVGIVPLRSPEGVEPSKGTRRIIADWRKLALASRVISTRVSGNDYPSVSRIRMRECVLSPGAIGEQIEREAWPAART